MVFLLVGLGVVLLTWLCWQLYRAKQFTQFKNFLNEELKPEVSKAIELQLEQSRCDTFPNNECHQQATELYWTQYPVRILQFALTHEILTKEQLIEQGKWRYCQHLFHVQNDKLG